MDIQQLRSWIFELYDPLENDRQYIVFDAGRGNLLIDLPPHSARAVRLIQGTGRNELAVITNRERARTAGLYRDTLGVRIAAHRDDADAVDGGADVVLEDDQQLRPDARAIRVRGDGQGATVVLLRKAGGVLVCGDLDLASAAARALLPFEFSAVLSAWREPVWNAGKDLLLGLQRDLPRPRKSFGIFLQAPWDRSYRGRLDDQMTPNPLVPQEETASAQAAMGPTTLVVSQTTPAKQARAPRPQR